jgi:hypothetical protein
MREAYFKVRLIGQILYDFYNNAPHDRGRAVRIDLLLIYHADALSPRKYIRYDVPRVSSKLEKYLFTFKDQNNKQSALAGIINILR